MFSPPRLLLCLLWLCASSMSVMAAEPPPAKRMQALARGVNLSIWYTYRDQPGIDPAQWYPAGSDWLQLKALGLTHVRVQFDPAYFRDPAARNGLSVERIAALQRDLAPAWANGLLVVLAADPLPAEKARLVRDDVGISELAAFWSGFAQALKGLRPDRLVFELLNEPGVPDAAVNRALMQRLAEAVRNVAPKHTLVVEGHGYSGIDELLAFEPLTLDNLVYSLHFYEPHNFTHQGATWSWEMFPRLKGLPYPASPELVQAAEQATADEDVKAVIRDYGVQKWDQSRIEARLDALRDWRDAKGVALWCGEFGTARLGAPEDSRQRWLADVRTALDARGIPWALFDYVGHFGLFSGQTGARELDQQAAQALGLVKAPRPAAQ
ncbi:MAG: cellulase family glycosylhydrolase [Pseudomonadota bacterium]